jgi:hypothetical protein
MPPNTHEQIKNNKRKKKGKGNSVHTGQNVSDGAKGPVEPVEDGATLAVFCRPDQRQDGLKYKTNKAQVLIIKNRKSWRYLPQ